MMSDRRRGLRITRSVVALNQVACPMLHTNHSFM